MAVPRDHRRDDPQGLSVRKHKHFGLINRQCITADLIGGTRKKMQIFGDIGGLPSGFLEHFAGVAGLDAPDLFGMGRQEICQPDQMLAALGGGHIPPGTVQGRRCGFHSSVHIRIGGLWDAGPRQAGGGINAVKGRPIRGRAPLAINQHLQCFKFSHMPLPCFFPARLAEFYSKKGKLRRLSS